MQLFQARAKGLALLGGHQVGGGDGEAGVCAAVDFGLPTVRRVGAKTGGPGKDSIGPKRFTQPPAQSGGGVCAAKGRAKGAKVASLGFREAELVGLAPQNGKAAEPAKRLVGVKMDERGKGARVRSGQDASEDTGV